MSKYTKMFVNSKLVELPLPFSLRLYIKKYNKEEYFKSSEVNDNFAYLVHDIIELSKKLIYDVDNGITPLDINNIITSNTFDDIPLPELQDLMSAISYACGEILSYLVAYDLLHENYYIQELSENSIILEIELK